MEELFKKFSKSYSAEMDKIIHEDDEQRSARNPVLFVFLGDKSIEASKEIYKHISSDWDNGDGILFFNLFSKEELNKDNATSKVNKDNVFDFNIPCGQGELKNIRKNIYDNFHCDSNLLIGLNKEITKVKNKILEYGNTFSSFEKINLAVITRVDDPLNVILAPITLLIKSELSKNFLIITSDLYALLVEKNENKDAFYTGALSISFFKEIEYFQSRSFYYEEAIEVFDEDRKLSVKGERAIFQLVYVLSDTNKKGVLNTNSVKENYNIIAYINLIKNRKINSESYYDIKNNVYDDVRFKRNITDENGEVILATAGLAVIERPNNAVAMTVLHTIYEDMLENMKKDITKVIDKIMDILKLDDENLTRLVEEIVPSSQGLEHMMGLMTLSSNISKGKTKKVTLREAERMLYGALCNSFYEENFERIAEEKLNNLKFEKLVREQVNKILQNAELGLYFAYLCTEETEVINALNEKIKGYEGDIAAMKLDIENIYENYIEESSFFKSIFSRKDNLKEIKKQIFNNIYGRKVKVIEVSMKKNIIENYIKELRKLNKGFKEKIDYLKEVGSEINRYTEAIIKLQDNYIGQNIKEYYSNNVKKKIVKLQEIYGKNFYFQDKFIGNIEEVLKNGIDQFIEKVEELCNNYILIEPEFSMAFEDELNERANMSSASYDKNIFTKDEMFKNLCTILENNSIPKVFIIDYNIKKYEEKYFFGDYSSDFIKYAYNFDKEWRTHSIGYIHEKRARGIEKLSLMGGFKTKDLMYYKNSIKYYEACRQDGYKLHGVDFATDVIEGEDSNEKKD